MEWMFSVVYKTSFTNLIVSIKVFDMLEGVAFYALKPFVFLDSPTNPFVFVWIVHSYVLYLVLDKQLGIDGHKKLEDYRVH